jgi:uncharacterized protein DUF1580
MKVLDRTHEKLLLLSEAAKFCPSRSGNGVNVATVWRWAKRGVHGVRLETIVCGGVRYTSREALERFFAGTTAAANGTELGPKTAADEHELNAEERELAAAGV